MKKRYQKRPYYLNQIKPFIGLNLIKVLVGQRRVGKSYVLLQLMDEIKVDDKTANIIYINKEDNQYDEIINYRDLIIYARKELLKMLKTIYSLMKSRILKILRKLCVI